MKIKLDCNLNETISASKNVLKLLEDHYQQEPTQVKVVNCGHGNWNEIHTESNCYIYDIGAGLWLKGTQIDALVEARVNELQKENKKIHLIISHWDKDHYQGLINVSDNFLKNLESFIAPRPNQSKLAQATIKKVLNKIRENIAPGKIYFIQPIVKSDAKNITHLNSRENSMSLQLYQGKGKSNVNKSGLLLLARNNFNYVCLTADQSWENINDALQNYVGAENNLFLMIPHHGGETKKKEMLEDVKNNFSQLKIGISCDGDNNSYKHPRAELISFLSYLELTCHRTDGYSGLQLGMPLIFDLDKEKIILNNPDDLL